jgi:AcrR family transcriptional regulator
MRQKKAGRPLTAKLDRLKVLRTALALCAKAGVEGMTLRALARELKVDPMAIYHYFPDRTAILTAALAHAYRDLAADYRPTRDAAQDAINLLESYRAISGKYVELMLYLMGQRQHNLLPIETFNAHLLEALGRQCRNTDEAVFVRDILIDYTHGYVIASRNFTGAEAKRYHATYERAVHRILGAGA